MMGRDEVHSYAGGDDGLVVTAQFALGVTTPGKFTVAALERNLRAALIASGITADIGNSFTIVQVEQLERTIPGEVLYEL